MPRALRIAFSFSSPDKCVISLFMTREVSVQRSCDLFLFTLKEHSSNLAVFPPRATFLHAFPGTKSVCLQLGTPYGTNMPLLCKLLQGECEAVPELLLRGDSHRHGKGSGTRAAPAAFARTQSATCPSGITADLQSP